MTDLALRCPDLYNRLVGEALKNLELSKRVKAKEISQSLSHEEGYIWSRLGSGGLKVAELLPLCPWPEEQTLRQLQSLIEKNAAEWMLEANSSPSKTASGEASPLSALDQDEGEVWSTHLEKDFRREILLKQREIETNEKNPYEVLQSHPRDSTNEIKAQYLSLSRKYHPDRFFGKELGPYKKRLENIFARIQKAYAQLKNPIDREALDKSLHLQSRKEALENSASKKSEGQAPAAGPAKKLSPELEKIGKAEHFYKLAVEQEKAKDYFSAYQNASQALSINSQRENYRKLHDRLYPLMLKEKSKRLFQEAERDYESSGASDRVLKKVDEVLRYDAGSAEAQLLCSRVIVEMKLEERFRSAKEMLLRAKASQPKNAEPCFFLGWLLLHLGESKAAKKELEEALKRNPQHLRSKKLLEKEF